MRPFALIILLFSCLTAAAVPRLDVIFPTGGKVDSTFDAEVSGKFDKWPVGFWCSNKQITITAKEKKGQVSIKIAADAPNGPCLIRATDDDGASAPRIFLTGRLPEVRESGDNNSIESALEPVQLPTTINGRLERRGDTDFFRFELKKGQTLIADLDGYNLLSPIDPFLHVFDPAGRDVALSSDTHNLDPFLTYTAKMNGEHLVQVFAIDHKASVNVSYSGSSKAVYRLHLTTGPWLHRTEPPTLEIGTTNQVRLIAINHDPVSSLVETGQSDSHFVQHPSFPNGLHVPTDTIKTITTFKPDTKINSPSAVSGVIGHPGTEVQWILPLKKKEVRRIRIEAPTLGSLLIPELIIRRPDKSIHKTSENASKKGDVSYRFTSDRDADWLIGIRDLVGRGGPDHYFRLIVETDQPDFELSTTEGHRGNKGGEEITYKLKLKRLNGYKSTPSLSIIGLPEGYSISNVKWPAKDGDVEVKVQLPTVSKIQHHAFRFTATDKEAGLSHDAVVTFQTGDSRGAYLIDKYSQLSLTVLPEPKEKKEAKK